MRAYIVLAVLLGGCSATALDGGWRQLPPLDALQRGDSGNMVAVGGDMSDAPDMTTFDDGELRGVMAPCSVDEECEPSVNGGRVWPSVCVGGACKFGVCGGPCSASVQCAGASPFCGRRGFPGSWFECFDVENGNHCPY